MSAERYQREYDRMMAPAESLARQTENATADFVGGKMEKSLNEMYEAIGFTEVQKVSARKKFRDWLTEYFSSQGR